MKGISKPFYGGGMRFKEKTGSPSLSKSIKVCPNIRIKKVFNGKEKALSRNCYQNKQNIKMLSCFVQNVSRF